MFPEVSVIRTWFTVNGKGAGSILNLSPVVPVPVIVMPSASSVKPPKLISFPLVAGLVKVSTFVVALNCKSCNSFTGLESKAVIT